MFKRKKRRPFGTFAEMLLEKGEPAPSFQKCTHIIVPEGGGFPYGVYRYDVRIKQISNPLDGVFYSVTADELLSKISHKNWKCYNYDGPEPRGWSDEDDYLDV